MDAGAHRYRHPGGQHPGDAPPASAGQRGEGDRAARTPPQGALRIVRLGKALDIAAQAVAGDPEPRAQKGPRPAARRDLPSRQIVERGEKELPGVHSCLGRLARARGPVVRAAPPVEVAGQAEFQLNAQPVRQADACGQVKLRAVADRAGIDRGPRSRRARRGRRPRRRRSGVSRARTRAAPTLRYGALTKRVRPGAGGSGRGPRRLVRRRGGPALERQDPREVRREAAPPSERRRGMCPIARPPRGPRRLPGVCHRDGRGPGQGSARPARCGSRPYRRSSVSGAGSPFGGTRPRRDPLWAMRPRISSAARPPRPAARQPPHLAWPAADDAYSPAVSRRRRRDDVARRPASHSGR